MRFKSPISGLGAALLLTLFRNSSTCWAAESAPAAPEYNETQKALFQALEIELTRFEMTIAEVTDLKYVQQLKEKLLEFRKRGNAVRKLQFDSSKYDDLRHDLAIEHLRVKQWLIPPEEPTERK